MSKIQSLFVDVGTRAMRCRALIVDVLLLWLSLTVAATWLDQPLPWLARVAAVVAAMFFLPNLDLATSTAKPPHLHLRRFAGQMGTLAATAIVWVFFLDLPLSSIAFAALWIPVSQACHFIGLRRGINWLAARQPALLSIRTSMIFVCRRSSDWLAAWPSALLAGRADVILVESLLIGLALWGGNGLVPGLWPALVPPVALALWVAAGILFRPVGLAKAPRFFATVMFFLTGLLLGTKLLDPVWSPTRLVNLVWIGTALTIYRWRLGLVSRSSPTSDESAAENLRWGALVVAGGILLHPFLIPSVHGTGDSLWYATMLADMIAQIRAGEFPVFIGQSIYQFNGSIYPLRVAPAFHHAGALVDLLTGFTLGPVAALNTLIFGTGLLALTLAYQSLRALLPSARWVAGGLSVLYISCPGTLGLAFNTDLLMSWMTVPWLPLVLYGTITSFNDPGYRPRISLAVGLGLLWWGHTPIALWSTLLAAAVQVFRLICNRRHLAAELRPLLAAAALFLSLVAYPVGSVLLYPPEPGVNAAGFQEAYAGSIAHFLATVRPAVWLPLSQNGRALADFQLGYSLWFALGFGLWVAWGRRSAVMLAPLIAAAGLALLLNAPSGLSQLLWSGVPAFVRNTTGNWAMNRLYLVQSGFIVFGIAAVVAARCPAGTRLPRAVAVTFAVGVLWSVVEAGKFAYGSHRLLRPPESGAMAVLPENVQITRFAYLVFPQLPPYFTHGVAEPALEQRLFRASDGALLSDNFAAAARGTLLGNFDFTAESGTEGKVLLLSKTLRLLPGEHYVLTFNYRAEPRGLLQIKGATILREYTLPEYGEADSFGFGRNRSPLLGLSNHTAVPQDVELRYFFDAVPGQPRPLSPFASVLLTKYEPSSLPVFVEEWIPYRARVRSPEAAWLETPRMYQTTYKAKIGGKPAAVRKSPTGLVSVAVPAGESVVELRYVAPLGLRTLYWLSLGTLVLVISATIGGSFWSGKRPG